MTDYNREFRVAELNRILPMVKDTMSRKEHVSYLDGKIYDLRHTETELEEKVESLERTLAVSVCDLPDIAVDCIRECLINYQAKLDNLKSSIADLQTQVDACEEKCSFEDDLYYSISTALAVPDGFLKWSEIQEESLDCYIYLLSLAYGFRHPITVSTLFEGKRSIDVFTGLMKHHYTPKYVEKVFKDIEL